MSRVTYTETQTTAAQDVLRQANQVRLVTAAEEGSGVNVLPGGVYGYSYSPGLANAPLFAVRRYRSFEIHKLASGEVVITGFAAAADARQMQENVEDLALRVQPEPEEGCDTLVTIPYRRIRHHRQYAAPNQQGFSVTLLPALA